MNRGIEIDSNVADLVGRSQINTQVEMGVAMRMACLEMVVGEKPSARRSGPARRRRNRARSTGRHEP
jgi:hypothetical protein